jgi:hypothetical protein
LASWLTDAHRIFVGDVAGGGKEGCQSSSDLSGIFAIDWFACQELRADAPQSLKRNQQALALVNVALRRCYRRRAHGARSGK